MSIVVSPLSPYSTRHLLVIDITKLNADCTLILCTVSLSLMFFTFELVDKVLDRRGHHRPGGTPVLRWTEPDMEEECRSRVGGGVRVFLRR